MRSWSGRTSTPPTSTSTASMGGMSPKPYPGSERPPGTVVFRGVPAHQRSPAVRLRDDRRAEDGRPPRRRRHHRPRVRKPRHPVTDDRGGEALRGCAQPPEPPVLRQPRHPEAPPRDHGPLPAPVRRRAGPRHAGVHDDRGEGGLLAPDVDAARPRRRRARPEPVVPDPHLGPDLRRRRGPLRAPRPRGGLLGEPARRVGGVVAAAPRHRPLLPAQPDDGVRRPRVHDAHGRVRQAARRAARARLRVRGPRLRRLRPAFGPAGARSHRRRRRAVHAHEVVLHGGMEDGVPRRERGGRGGAGQAQELPRLRHVPAHPDRVDRRHERGARLSARGQRGLPGPP